MSSAAVSEQPNSRMSFKPSWMGDTQPAVAYGGGGGQYMRRSYRHDSTGENGLATNELGHGVTTIGASVGALAPPKMAKHRFSREELLALYTTVDLSAGPTSLLLDNFSEFVTSVAHQPITMTQMNEHEERLFHQHGINSSKALSALSPQERHQLGLAPISIGSGIGGGGFTPAWATDRGGRGGYRGSMRGGLPDTRGGRGTYVLGRGGGRAGSMTALGGGRSEVPQQQQQQPQMNTRAQGLYDPHDPRDRPRVGAPVEIVRGTRGIGGWRGGRGATGPPGYTRHDESHQPAWMDDDDEDEYEEDDGVAVLRAGQPPKEAPNADKVEQTQQTRDKLDQLFKPPKETTPTAATLPAAPIDQATTKTRAAVERHAVASQQRSMTPDEFKHTHLVAEELVNSFATDDDAPLRKAANGPKSDVSSVDLIAKARTRPQTFATPVDAVQARAAVAAAKAPMQTTAQTPTNSSNVVESLESMLRQGLGIKVTPSTGAPIQQHAQRPAEPQSMTNSVKNANPIGAYDSSSVKQKHETVNSVTPKPATPQNASSVPPMAYTIDDEWFYVDPKGIQQGPFRCEQMSTWCRAGYFTKELQLRRRQETTTTPLQTLIERNHGEVPFVAVVEAASRAPTANSGDDAAARAMALKQQHEATEKARAAQIIEQQERIRIEEQQRMAEQQERARRAADEEMRARHQQMETEEREKQRAKQEDTIRRQQDQLKAQQQQILLRQQQQLMQEGELRQRQQQVELEQKRKEQEQQAAAAANAQQSSPFRRQITLGELFGLDKFGGSSSTQQQQQQPPKQAASVWGGGVATTAPVTNARDGLATARSLRDIQAEEERRAAQERAEQRQQHEAMSNARVVAAQGVWAQTTGARAPWAQQQQPTWGSSEPARGVWDVDPPAQAPAANNRTSTANTRNAPNANHQQQQQQQPPKTSTKAGGGASKSAEQSVKAAMTAVALDKDGFSDWVIEQCRALDKSVDAEMLTAFLNVVDSAQDVEDYVLSYFRDTQRTRDFVQTYLRRRTDYRRGLEVAAVSSKQTADMSARSAATSVDAMKPPTAAPSQISPNNNSGGSSKDGGGFQTVTKGGKKKKPAMAAATTAGRGGGGGKLQLGFSTTTDSSRLNRGEIDRDY